MKRYALLGSLWRLRLVGDMIKEEPLPWLAMVFFVYRDQRVTMACSRIPGQEFLAPIWRGKTASKVYTVVESKTSDPTALTCWKTAASASIGSPDQLRDTVKNVRDIRWVGAFITSMAIDSHLSGPLK